jgi:NAD(P)-dependent dehydrogenase (short-subunit alcohol dehydrogenase family)
MDLGLAGRACIVTGASRGIGLAAARTLAAEGARVLLTARSEDALAEAARACAAAGGAAAALALDATAPDAGERAVAACEEHFGGVDVLVNNAGIPKRRRVPDLTPDVVESVMRINYFSPIRLTLALLPGIEKRGGRVVNISSVAARLGPPAEAAYAASKAAVTAWSESMQVDLGIAGSDVKVHVVNPGVFDTELFHLPDNDDFTASVEMLPVESIVAPILAMIESGTFELYVPEWFGEIAAGKAKDTGTFLEGSIAWVRQQNAEAAG